MTMSGKSTAGPGECTLRLHDGKADEYNPNVLEIFVVIMEEKLVLYDGYEG